MSSDPVTLVEKTWAIAAGVEGVTETFYNRMWEIDPTTKPLFARSNMKAQAQMLAVTIDVAVKHLRHPDILIPILQDLGKRHCRYGVRKSDYNPGGEALLWTLQHYLGDGFTPEVKEAWTGVWTTIANTMGAEGDTEEGRRLLEEYDAKYPREGVPRLASGSSNRVRLFATVAALALFVVAAVVAQRQRR